METKKPQLHQSALNTASRCMEQFRRRYIELEKIAPGVAARVGTATDKSVTANLGNKIKTKELLPIEQVRDTARDAFLAAWDEGVTVAPGTSEGDLKVIKGEAIDKTVRLSSLHAVTLATEIEPTHVAFPFVIELPDYPVDIAGEIDIREANSVRDTKTSGKSKTQREADVSLQLTVYHEAVALIDGTAPEVLSLDCLVDNKVPKATVLKTKRRREDFNVVLARVEEVTKAMQKGVFMPANQTDWWCDERFCGYASTCKYYQKEPIQIAMS